MAKLKEDNLDPNFKKAWVSALRSGEYEQGCGTLKTEDTDSGTVSFCCLGVLREVASHVRANQDGDFLTEGSSGLTEKTQEFLANHNDGDTQKWSFKRIATWIEKHL